jgi:hypothetical protein
MMNSAGFSPEYLAVTTVYLLLFVVSLYGSLLYWRAYRQMKHTSMIKSIMLVLIAIAFDTLYWLVTTVDYGYGIEFSNTLLMPWLAVIPKFLLLCAVAYFVHASLSPNESPTAANAAGAKECVMDCRKR